MEKKEVPAWRRDNLVLKWLRGSHNSIRMRFITVPLDYLRYYRARLAGQSYTEYYARRMDRGARKVANRPVSQRYLDDAGNHLKFLVDHGLQPEDRVLDYGCGVMRTGIKLLEYLQPGNYVGVDISQERLNKGRRLAQEAGIPQDSYTLKAVKDCHIHELEGEQFDIIWSVDVMAHMPIEECRLALQNMRRLLKPGGRIYFTYSQSNEPKRLDFKDFWFTEAQVREISEAAGYRFVSQDDWLEYRPAAAKENFLVQLSIA